MPAVKKERGLDRIHCTATNVGRARVVELHQTSQQVHRNLDKDGKKQDAALHEEMLNNEAADKWARNWSRQFVRELGVDEETIKLMYGDD